MAIIYTVFIEAEVHAARRSLPGHVRQRIYRTITEFAHTPRPSNSEPLTAQGLAAPPGVEIRRVRLEQWRIIYAVYDGESWVWVLAIRKRPPYAYADLPNIIARLP